MRFPFFGMTLLGGTIVFFILFGRALALGPSGSGQNSAPTSAVDPNQQKSMLGCRGVPPKQARGLKQILSDDTCDKCLRVAKVAAENAAVSMANEIQKKICSSSAACRMENLAGAITQADAFDPVKGCKNPCVGKCIPAILPSQYDPDIQNKISDLLEQQERQRMVQEANRPHSTVENQKSKDRTKDEDHHENVDDDDNGNGKKKGSRGCGHCARTMSKIGRQTARAFVRGLCDCNGLHCWNVYENGLLAPVCHLVAGSTALAMNTLWTGTTTIAVCTAVCARDTVKGVVQGQLDE